MTKPNLLFFDTCFYIDVFHGKLKEIPSFKQIGLHTIIGHALVFMELYQGARTPSEKKAIGSLEKSLSLIGPSIPNYIQTGKLLKEMKEKGWLSSKRLYETQNDVLLAISAIEANSWIATRNKKDFDKIQKLCPVKVLYY